jgi:hypothetical protein
MKIKTINVEVPKGCTAEYDAATQTIKFIPIEDYTVIKDFKTACRVLGISNAIPAEIKANKQLCAIYKMQIVLKAVNRGHTFNLISGRVWYPYVRFIGKSNVDSEIARNESRVLDFNYEDRTFTLVGGNADTGLYGGLSVFGSYSSVGYSTANFGFFACHNEQIAHHVSKYFAALVFDCCFARELGFSLSNNERVTKNYPID